MFRNKKVKVHFVGIGGIGMSGIAEVLLNLGYRVSGSDLKDERHHPAARVAGRRDRRRPPRRERRLDVDVVVDLQRGPQDNPEVIARAGSRHPGDPARRDARRADAPEGRRRHRRLAWQDHHHLADRHRAGARRARPDRGGRRQAQRARLERAAGQGRAAWWPRPTRATAPSSALAADRGRHQRRPRAPRPLRQVETLQRPSSTSPTGCRSTGSRCCASTIRWCRRPAPAHRQAPRHLRLSPQARLARATTSGSTALRVAFDASPTRASSWARSRCAWWARTTC